MKLTEQNTLTEVRMEECRAERYQHRIAYMREKHKYYKHRQKGVKGKGFCFIMDAMDQNKTMMPRYTRVPGGTERHLRLKLHLVGVLMHKEVKQSAVFTCTELWPHDSNLTIESIMRTMLLVDTQLPDVMNAQFDNCWRENKNQKVFGFLAYLVYKKVFRKVSK